MQFSFHIRSGFTVKDITVANNEKLIVECAGDIDIVTQIDNVNYSVTIINVLYVPGLITNLLSINNNNNKVHFHHSGCDIFYSNDRIIATASLIDSVYKLNFVKFG